MLVCDLRPLPGQQKSFYGKAKVVCGDNGFIRLDSYNTPIMYETPDGTFFRLWDGWTATTGKHIKAFSGLNKAGFMALPCVPLS